MESGDSAPDFVKPDARLKPRVRLLGLVLESLPLKLLFFRLDQRRLVLLPGIQRTYENVPETCEEARRRFVVGGVQELLGVVERNGPARAWENCMA